ncbi:U3 small nucleolar RNA-associated protein 11 [Pleomassaria siparia CBS 279.74]|uniref:U3 small nucleolar RNA-associated protein 11 n=1 Tax=Pleomassaria siparia CBS 279.74 TaxID=1314801 RepID=A0A6G1KLG5_9PLEO|nr:U3 small nucleolar RNA-associated protein 11 [Pleomassaria siparia CBS 279.74]
MSSMRNAVQRRNHKERAQPLERQKWGLLEKAKDYKLRAKDHKMKKKTLKILKQKVANKNPDEFSFGMLSSTVDKQGIKVADRGNKALEMDVVKLMKTQDAGYIRTMLQVVRKQRKELEEKIVLGEGAVRTMKGEDARKASHTVFVGDRKEQRKFESDEWFGTGGEWPESAWNRPRKQVEVEKDSDEEDNEAGVQPKKPSKKQQEAVLAVKKEKEALMKKRERAQDKQTGILRTLMAKERALATADERLEQQRAKMNSTVGGTNKTGVKFKLRERKK